MDRLDGEVRAAGAAGDEEDVAAFLGDGAAGAAGVAVFSEVWVDVVVRSESTRLNSSHLKLSRMPSSA